MNLKDYPILCVDDEKNNRLVLKHNLEDKFSVLFADSANSALEILAAERVAVLLADYKMPNVTGVDLAEKTLGLYPDIVRVIITAYSDLEATIDAINRARVNRFIKKPWTKNELVAVMEECISSFHNAQLVKEIQARFIEMDRAACLGIMMAGIAHDLRQPIAHIKPNAEMIYSGIKEMLKMEISPELAHKRLLEIKAALDDLKFGIDGIDLFSTSLLCPLREKTSNYEKVDLNKVIENALVITRSTIAARATLKIELPEEKIFVDGLESQLHQLIVNLLLNAVQAMDTGMHSSYLANKIIVRLKPTANAVSIEIEDTGCGIQTEQIEKIFTPFFTTKGSSGCGLGLTICKQIVEDLKGTINVHSVPGQGSCFVVVLPRASTRGCP